MANIPGISGFVQPGTFAKDRVVSRGVSIPGGSRILTIMGLGETSVTLVDGASGAGQDGISTPSGENPNGRFFQIPQAPLQSGRVRVFLNGSELALYEGSFNGSDDIQAGFDAQIDLETGVLGLQSATFEDQNGKNYLANPSNVGDGQIQDGLVGTLKELAILDLNAPSETWTLRCTSVSKDATGINQKGKATFSCSGSISGQLKDENGNALVFTDTYKSGTDGKVHGNSDFLTSTADGYVLMDGPTARTTDMGVYLLSTSSSATEVNYVAIPLNSTGAGDDTTDSFVNRIMAGDFLVTLAGGDPDNEVHEIEYFQRAVSDDLFAGGPLGTIDHQNEGYAVFELKTPIKSSSGFTMHTVDNELDLSTSSIGVNFTHANNDAVGRDFKIVATNVFEVTGSSNFFNSRDVGKVLLIDGSAEDRYTVSAITEPNTAIAPASSVVRVHKYGDEDTSIPTLNADETVNFSLVETNGVLTIGIDGTSSDVNNAFSVGDKFTIKITSKTLVKDDLLDATYISKSNVNDPEFFTVANQLFAKHGSATTSNTLSLGAQMAYENGAPGILAVQCKPAIPRKTSVTLIDERSGGRGGIQFNSLNAEVNDAIFTIPIVKTGGYRKGRPDRDTAVNIFRIRNGKEEQIFPNKSTFYSAAQADLAGKDVFLDSGNDFAFSYTICETDYEEFGGGTDGFIVLDGTTGYFSSSSFNFDSVHDGKQILIKSLTKSDGSIIEDATEIGALLNGGSGTAFDVNTSCLDIDSITSDTTVKIDGTFNTGIAPVKIIFTVLDTASTENKLAAILFNKSVFTTNTLKNGDGLKIQYIDQNDSDYFDTNWFESFSNLEAFETQIIVPLPDQTKSNIFQAAVAHCETMSSIANRKERVALIGAISGVTDKAILGEELVAVENIGILEGIQGDDPEEILDNNIEDLQDFKLKNNFTSNRCVYFFPDQIVRSIFGTNTLIDGFYAAAAAGGRLAGTQNVAIPLTNKVLTGFNILRDRVYSQITLNRLGDEGATVIVPVAGGGRILAGRTTSNSGYIEDEEISIIFIRDRVKAIMRESMQGYIGRIQDSSTNVVVQARVVTILNSLINQGLIESFKDASVSRDKVDPRQINVFFRFVPTFPINYVFIDIELGIS